MFSSRIRILIVISIFGLSTATKSAFTTSADLTYENYLTEFMNDLNKSAFDTIDLRCAIVIGNKENYLQSTKTVLEHIPHLIADEPSAIPPWTCFGSGSVSFVFVDGMTYSELKMVLVKYPSPYASATLLLLSTDPGITDLWITNYIRNLREMGLRNVSFGHLRGKVMTIYRLKLVESCQREVVIINRWTSGRGFLSNQPVVGRNRGRVNDLGCPKVVSTMDLPPSMRLTRDPNTGEYRISGGSEGNLINALADYFNFVPVVLVPSVKEKLLIGSNGTSFGILGDVSRETAHLGIGQILQTPKRWDIVDFTTSYQSECVVWTLPLKLRLPNVSTMIDEFNLHTWSIVILIFLLCSGLVHLTARLNRQRNRRSLMTNVLDVISMSMSIPITWRPSGMSQKLLFICYLHYIRVISTAYSSSLASILTTMNPGPEVLSEEDIVAAGLITAGTENSRELLADQIDLNNSRAELLYRYQEIKSTEEALTRITEKQDIAYLRHKSAIDYYKTELILQGKQPDFYTLNKCVASFGSAIAVIKGSIYIDPFNDVITQLRESGIYKHWKYPSASRNLFSHQSGYDYWEWQRLSMIFYFYLFCLIPAVVSFFAEQGAFKFQNNR